MTEFIIQLTLIVICERKSLSIMFTRRIRTFILLLFKLDTCKAITCISVSLPLQSMWNLKCYKSISHIDTKVPEARCSIFRPRPPYWQRNKEQYEGKGRGWVSNNMSNPQHCAYRNTYDGL